MCMLCLCLYINYLLFCGRVKIIEFEDSMIAMYMYIDHNLFCMIVLSYKCGCNDSFFQMPYLKSLNFLKYD